MNYGITNFDNLLYSFLTVFQCMTLEGWFKIMTLVIDAHNMFVPPVYFVLAITICHYLFYNLTIAVMVTNL